MHDFRIPNFFSIPQSFDVNQAYFSVKMVSEDKSKLVFCSYFFVDVPFEVVFKNISGYKNITKPYA